MPEVYLQRLVFFDDNSNGLARPESALFEKTTPHEEETIQRAEELARELGVIFNASGATEPGTSIKTASRRSTVVALPPSLDTHVLYRHRARSTLLHRTVFHAWL